MPKFNFDNLTPKARNVSYSFSGVENVESGIIDMYNLYRTKVTNSYSFSYISQTFRNCGSSTETGAAELAQIPSNWK